MRSGLHLPDMAMETRPVLGLVQAAGPESPYEAGQTVVLRPSVPTVGYPLSSVHGDRIVIDLDDVVGHIEGTEFYPKAEDVLITPDWRTKYHQPSSIIYIPDSALEDNQPCMFGIVCRVGKGCQTLRVGDYVVYPNTGFEIGLIDTVYYILPEKEIFATLHAN